MALAPGLSPPPTPTVNTGKVGGFWRYPLSRGGELGPPEGEDSPMHLPSVLAQAREDRHPPPSTTSKQAQSQEGVRERGSRGEGTPSQFMPAAPSVPGI